MLYPKSLTSPLSEKPSNTSDPPPPKGTATESSAKNPPTEYGPGSMGFTYELCAGLVDKKASLEQIASEEILEETGYKVAPQKIE